MAKIVQERERCLGCGSCAAMCPKYWKMAGDGKSILVGSEKNPKGDYELEVEEVGCNREAADACPVEIIHIIE